MAYVDSSFRPRCLVAVILRNNSVSANQERSHPGGKLWDTSAVCVGSWSSRCMTLKGTLIH